MSTEWRNLVTCEHGGNQVPRAYRHLFPAGGGVLSSHRGWDPGALVLARALARRLDAPLFYATTSRLLIDLNRSPSHPALFSPYTRGLSPARRQAILERHYLPYRRAVEDHVRSQNHQGWAVLHLSAHSFTPRIKGEVRRTDLGLLYDPQRPRERIFCQALKRALAARLPGLSVRRNYPYRGTADGLTTWLRRHFGGNRYLGVEVELNQRIARVDPAAWRALRTGLCHAVADTLAEVNL